MHKRSKVSSEGNLYSYGSQQNWGCAYVIIKCHVDTTQMQTSVQSLVYPKVIWSPVFLTLSPIDRWDRLQQRRIENGWPSTDKKLKHGLTLLLHRHQMVHVCLNILNFPDYFCHFTTIIGFNNWRFRCKHSSEAGKINLCEFWLG